MPSICGAWLVAEPFVARPLVESAEAVARSGGRSGRRRSGRGSTTPRRSDQVVHGEPVRRRRELRLFHVGAQRPRRALLRVAQRSATPGSMPLRIVHLARECRRAGRGSRRASGSSTGAGRSTVVESHGSRPAITPVQQRTVNAGLCDRPDLVEGWTQTRRCPSARPCRTWAADLRRRKTKPAA